MGFVGLRETGSSQASDAEFNSDSAIPALVLWPTH
jgi:hypothetical protein